MFCSNAPVLPKNRMNALPWGVPLLRSVSTQWPQEPLADVPAWNQHIPVCESPPMLLFYARAAQEKDASNIPMLEVVGTPSSTSVVLE